MFGAIFVGFLNGICYYATKFEQLTQLECLKAAMNEKCPSLVNKDTVIFYHNNAKYHIVVVAQR